MSVAQTLRAPETPCRSEERAQLGRTIERRTALEARLASLKAARTKAVDEWSTANAAAESAAAALEDARKHDARRTADAFLGLGDPNAPTVKEAESAVQAAVDDADRLRRAILALDEDQKAVRRDLEWVEFGLRGAVAEVVKVDPAVAQLCAEYAVARQRFEELAAKMGFLAHNLMLPPAAGTWNLFVDFEAPLPDGSPWRAAIEALRNDPNAALPDV